MRIYAIEARTEEEAAVITARTSRSANTFAEIAEEVQEFGYEAFLKKNVLDYGHDCYDADTEVLTRDGWLPWPTVAAMEQVPSLATLEPESEEIQFMLPERIIDEPYEGRMYRLRSKYLDLLVTPNHRLWAQVRPDNRNSRFRLVEATEVKGQPMKMSMVGAWTGQSVKYPLPFLRLLGFFLGDGEWEPRLVNAARFRLRKEGKIAFLTTVCEEGGFQLSEHKDDRYYVKAEGIGSVARECVDANRERVIPRPLMEGTREELQALLDGLLASDGSIDPGGCITFYSTSKPLADQVTELALKLQMGSYIRPTKKTGWQKRTVWAVTLNRTVAHPLVNKLKYDLKDSWEEYAGRIYCAEMPANHILFVRRNGRPVWSGNSVAEGAQCPWIAVENISDLAACVLCLADPQLRVQMTSTRYQKMNARNVTHRSGGEGDELAVALMALHEDMQERANKAVEPTDYPRKLTLSRDISRGWLPAGIGSQLAVRHDARGMRDTICYLLGHPLEEVNAIGEGILAATKQYVEVLLERHIQPAPSKQPQRFLLGDDAKEGQKPGEAFFVFEDLLQAEDNLDLHDELRLWKESGYRRRHRIAACPYGPWVTASIYSDWGAYRDLRRNRTLAQPDILPDPQDVFSDPLWAFREGYPDVCDALGDLGYVEHYLSDNYLALMGTPVIWPMGGHFLNWAYALRLRSKIPGCHPAYALPMRSLMRQILEHAPKLAAVLDLVEDQQALGGVEFRDRASS